MLTVKRIKPNGTQEIMSTDRIDFYKDKDDKWVLICLDAGRVAGEVFAEGRAFVMNSHGATVGDYDLG